MTMQMTSRRWFHSLTRAPVLMFVIADTLVTGRDCRSRARLAFRVESTYRAGLGHERKR
jgi:hypothetical protein